MSVLEQLLPLARMVEVDHIDIDVEAEKAWPEVRHGDLGRSPWIRALFAIRGWPSRLLGKPAPDTRINLDSLVSTPARPGFQVLIDDPPREVAVGAIGQVWHGEIPFLHVSDPEEFLTYAEPGWVKVAWAIRVEPRGVHGCRVAIEVRVDATDEESWRKFRRYFLLVGPGSRFIRKSALHALAKSLGDRDAIEDERPLFGDERLPDAGGQLTHGIDIAATPEQIWPWLLQLGCHRGGYYSYDLLDNGGERSARQIHPELQQLQIGQVLPATPESKEGFEVLAIDPNRALLLGGLWDVAHERQLPFASPRPDVYWQITWAFVLEPIDLGNTRLHVRARAAFAPDERLHAASIRPVHSFMEHAQLRNLKARAEEKLPADDWRDVLAGIGGAAWMALAFLSPFLRSARNHWGLTVAEASRPFPGDALIEAPRWSWTHAIEIDAPAEAVWPWIAQIGADRGGFYSYQWLENLAGCHLQNAEAIHPDWAVKVGDPFSLHPKGPALEVVEVVPGHHYVVSGAPDPQAIAEKKPWAAVSWVLLVEPIGPGKSRFISRFRAASSNDLPSRLGAGPMILEPVGFAMDRRMLQSVKGLAEAQPDVSLA